MLLALALGLDADLDRLGPAVGELHLLGLPLDADVLAVLLVGEGDPGDGEAEDDQDDGGDEGGLAAHN